MSDSNSEISSKNCFTDLTIDNQLYEILKAIDEIPSGGGGITAIRGQVSRMTSGTITVGTAGTYQSTGLTATLDATTAAGMSLGTTDTFAVKNTTSATRILKIYASMDASANNNEQLGIKMAKNGTEINETECRANTGSNNFAKLVTNWMISMAPNDEVALFVANHSSTNTITLQRGRVTASFVD